MLRWIGIDIGGANLKAASTREWTSRLAFPLWRMPHKLPAAIADLIHNAPVFDAVAVTMTGEMVDCFSTREEGVCIILDALTTVMPSALTRVYSTDGSWLSVPNAARNPWQVAASNWRALAEYSLRWTDQEPTILVDIGSTTCDILALDGKLQKILSKSKTDRDRLMSGELVYTGAERSNVAGLIDVIELHQEPIPVINELFATTADVHLLLGHIEEEIENLDTADGRPRTRSHAAYRLARIIGEDGSTLAREEIILIAEAIYQKQVEIVSKAMLRVAMKFGKKDCSHVLFSGHADYLIDDAIDHLGWDVKRSKLSLRLGRAPSACGPAYALAVLADEKFPQELE
jgi:(4-(4-[2-(gamma-L-glutamylamino)ethyl]phenoxymethyl)furan-2-yl)methanamine synthase